MLIECSWTTKVRNEEVGLSTNPRLNKKKKPKKVTQTTKSSCRELDYVCFEVSSLEETRVYISDNLERIRKVYDRKMSSISALVMC